MDTRFSAEDLAFQAEVRQFLKEAWDQELQATCNNRETMKQGVEEWQRRLYRKGWMAPHWPVEHGGTNWSVTQSFIYNSERAAVGAPEAVAFGVTMVASVIIAYGSDAQKARFLPRILKSEDWWCQGYSEPGAGSDLASLKTRADREGEEYVINGSKIWTTYAQYADWIFCLVRTDSSGRKQEGITFLLIDMKSPGITVRPIHTIDGFHHLNEVFFDNVRVPVENRIGEEGKGWTYAKSLLVHERLSIAEVADSKRALAEVRELARREINGGTALLSDPLFSKRLTDVEIDLMALEFTELRVLAAIAEGKAAGPESSLLKLQGTEIQQAIQTLRMDVAGYYSGTLQGELSAAQLGHEFADYAQKMYFRGRASSIYGGSNEVQKNITAKFVLGLWSLKMNFNLSEEQGQIRDSIARFVAENYAFDQRNAVVAMEHGFSDAHWQQFAELGWLSIPFAEEHGGFGGGAVDTMVIMQEFGRGLVAEPYLATVVLFGGLLQAAASAELQAQYIPQIIAGELQGAFAYLERQSRYAMADIATRAVQKGAVGIEWQQNRGTQWWRGTKVDCECPHLG
ncbi:MAG: acyl-CoA dehydrogenase family protein [Halioglobus sp.]